ncbi:uncharacterized protein CIMG_12563 [Coccidioides immitis RS]|uniref:Uncharacterized protein n=1 Tax=Coccidioides immitis (strain RS) TaxID=246410 RepID=A0A0D8JRD9_COCIM|nr:uncharacterized protein CIMG_12563 [Coccidioides immitis RS]KJF59915.1 hypothetical protein CIMG_12563 [Coccidioides immitis RS]
MKRDYYRCPEKIIILTEFLCIIHILKMLQKQDYCVAAVYSNISVKNQGMCINTFNQNLLLSEDETDVSSDILISILEILDINYICIHAFQLILLSPSWLERDKTQSKTCIYHYRQMNKIMYTYCLMCRDVQIKSNILDWQAMQKSFNKLAMLLQREAGIVQDMIDLDTV